MNPHSNLLWETVVPYLLASGCLTSFNTIAFISTRLGNDILPKVQVRPSHVRTREGESVTIECKVSSTLPVTVTWSRADGSPLNKNYLMKDEVLLIRSVRKNDEGTYICVAENKFGASKASVELVINI